MSFLGRLKSVSRRRKAIVAMALLLSVGFAVAHFNSAQAAVAFRAASTGNNGTGGTTVAAAAPTGTLANDVMVAVVTARGSVTITGTGWTQINTFVTTGTVIRSSTFYKVATGSDGTQSFTLSATGKASVAIASYSGVDTLSPVDVSGGAAVNTANTANGPMNVSAITTTVPNAMVIAMFGNAITATFTAGSSMVYRIHGGATSGAGANTRTTSGIQDVVQSGTGTTGEKFMTSNASSVYVGHILALRPNPELTQAKYRFFANSDSLTASTPLAGIDTAASIGKQTPFRLRMNLGISSTSSNLTLVAGRSYKLQFAVRGSDNVCDTSFTNESSFTDVGASTDVQFFNNPTPADGATYSTSANDPTRGLTNVGQYYEEVAPMALRAAVGTNQDAFWDLSLTTSASAPEGAYYCLRVVNGDGTNLAGGYAIVPQVYVQPPTITQSNYRWYPNADSAAPGTPTVAQNTAMTSPTGVPFRLRQRLAIDNAQLGVNAGSYKLQYAEKSGTCSASFAGATFFANPPPAATSQSKITGSVTNNNTFGTTQWASPENATADDSVKASVNLSSGVTSTYLEATSFGFNIPTDSVIKGITVSADRNGSNTNDARVRLMKASTIYTTDRSEGMPFVNSSGNWGGSEDLWGVSWKPADVNAGGFGVAIAVAATANGFAEIDDVSITINYEPLQKQTKFAGAATNRALYGWAPWLNTGNVTANDGASASASSGGSSATDTDYLRTSNHGFTIPSTATIRGIGLSGLGMWSAASGDASSIMLYDGSTLSNNLATYSYWSGNNTWGGIGEMWGKSWTPAMVNGTGFGGDMGVYMAFGGDISIDAVSIDVYYTDSAASVISFYDNPIPSSGTTISSSNDPTGRTTVYQSYNETDPYLNSVAAIASGSDGLWDFSLTSTAAANGKTYCFRTVKADGTPLDTYSVYPEITFSSGSTGPTLDQQVRGGASVVNGTKSPLTF